MKKPGQACRIGDGSLSRSNRAKSRAMKSSIHTLASLSLLVGSALCQTQSFYKEDPLFSTAPDPKKSVETIGRFGPVGMAIELHQPAFTMVVGDIEPGSPAAAAGALKKGQFIESINGGKLKDIDPRIQLGQILEAAEAKDGVIKFMVKDDAKAAAKEVIVKIPVLGAYSKAWPADCQKSEKIIRGFADYVSKPGSNKGFADAGMLFLLSTGEEKDLAVVRDWVHGLAGKKQSGYAWHIGFGGIPLCEYYLRTGDPKAMPVIQSWVNSAAKGEYLDGWAGRGGVVKLGYGNGHLNAGGTAVVTFLMLAKQCGADVNDSLLQRTLTHFFRYAGRGINPYGDDRPETSFVDNGKHGNLAFAMAAAASLTPDGDKSIYAKARDMCAMASFYTTTFMLHGHTGGGIGEIWRSGSMALLPEKKPLQYREFMDHRKWHYDLSRRFDGSFAILGGAGYDNIEWGGCFPWAYTFPRKTLRITGAPPSKFSKTYQLPARPWGTEADDIFLSMTPVAGKDGKSYDISGEILTKDSSRPLIIRLNEKELSDDEIRHYVYHPEYLIRNMVSNNAAGLSCDYMFPKPGKRVRPELLEEFARHSDPRVRNAGIRATIKAFDPSADWCKRIFDIAIERLKDDKESWFVKDACLALVQRGTPDMIVPHADLILTYLKHPEQWLQNGALMVLAQVITDERCAAKIIPPMGDLISRTPRQSTTSGPIHAIREKLPAASPTVRDLALKAIGDAYQNYSGGTKWVGGQDLTGHRKDTLEMIAGALTGVQGGLDVLYQVSKKQYPDDPLPHDELFLSADPETFGPELKKTILPLIREKLIYQYIGINRGKIFNDLKSPVQRGAVTNSIDGLVDLYQKVGVHEYDWKPFGPDLKNAKWNYFTFDPAEKQAYDLTPWRYRTVTYPKGMENWFAREFDPAKAGWKTGQFPIGQYKGKLTDNDTRNPWKQVPRSLWENEVLLVNGAFEIPALKPGHIYRLRVQTGQGVGAGDGFKLYINGNAVVETKEGLGRRGGDTIRGAWITPDIAKDFGNGPVTIAATSFLRYGDRAIVQMPPVPQGIFSMWLEERKLPPLDDAVLTKAATFVPMLSAEWQAQNDPANSKEATDEDKFRYDGKFIANPKLAGTWKTVALVNSIDEFSPDKKTEFGRSPIKQITFKDQGSTDSPNWIWSGDTLMDLDRSQALKITVKDIGGTEHLFIESGGFGPKNPSGWQSPLMVLKRG
jgi:hypothetical protein